jgi:LuxR family maltose regulon positive regulatory protein
MAYLAWAEIQITLGNPQPALVYLQRQLYRASENGLKNRVIELSVLQALGWRTIGDRPRARAALEHALSIAQPEGYMCTFDQGPALTQLLVEAARQGFYREYTEDILNSTGKKESLKQREPVDHSAQMPFGERLSERELEVLRLIAQGTTNLEIAERLVITVGTVKSHINHIFSKLDVHNRTEAVARARGLGLLEI